MRERSNLRNPLVARRALRWFWLLKREQVINVNTSLVADIELQEELFDVEGQEGLIDHEVELFGSDLLFELLITLILFNFKQELLDNLGQVFGR